MALVARPEIELLLRSARTTALADAANRARLRALTAGPVDWPEVLALAQAQGVLPLVWATLQAAGPDAVPPDVRQRAEAEAQTNLRRNLFLTRAFVNLLTGLVARGLAALPYKGPVLATQVYGRPSLRQFADLDILVHRRDVQAARAHLQAAGYRQTWPAPDLSPAQEQLHLDTKYNFTFTQQATGVALELHWTLTPNYIGFPTDPEELWTATDTMTLGGLTVQTFSTTWLLLILCMHGANHCWLKLSQVCDVAEMVRATPALDWEAVEALARAQGCARILHLGLGLAQTLLEAKLPVDVGASVAADRPAARMAAEVVERICTQPYHWLGPFEEPRFHLRMRERWRDKARYVLAMARPTVRDLRAVRLPPALGFLYYLIRPIRLMAEHGVGLWGQR